MYILPQPHACPKCGFECKYGPHDPFPAPILSEGPVCPRCCADFLRQHCGVMEPSTGERSDPERRAGAIIQNSFS